MTTADTTKRARPAKALAHVDAAHDSLMKCVNCLAKAVTAHRMAITEKKAGKAAGEFNHEEVLGHLHEAAKHAEMAADHHTLAKAALGGTPGGEADEHLTGDPAGGVNTGGSKELQEKIAAAGFVSKDTVEALVKAAVAEATKGQVEKHNGELLETINKLTDRIPAGPGKARLFAVDKGAMPGTDGQAQETAAQLLTKGITVDPENPDSVTDGVTGMIANMHRNRKVFARSVVSDPNFRGSAGAR